MHIEEGKSTCYCLLMAVKQPAYSVEQVTLPADTSVQGKKVNTDTLTPSTSGCGIYLNQVVQQAANLLR